MQKSESQIPWVCTKHKVIQLNVSFRLPIFERYNIDFSSTLSIFKVAGFNEFTYQWTKVSFRLKELTKQN